jgi:hypothetical protein
MSNCKYSIYNVSSYQEIIWMTKSSDSEISMTYGTYKEEENP